MKLVSLLFLALVVTSASAKDIELVGHITQPIKQPQTRSASAVHKPAPVITLLKMQLSEKARHVIINRGQMAIPPVIALSNDAGAFNVQLGMNNVPVLNQGSHGTCATFANTAAISAALNKDDYVSQLCLLQLGRYLENSAYSPSGWDGSLGRTVLSQIDMFGIVSKQRQMASGCAGLTNYPIEGSDPDTAMSIDDYHLISEPLPQDEVVWSPVLDIFQAVLDTTDTARTMYDIKQALRSGDRVTFGVLLADFQIGTAGAVGTFHVKNDTWVFTQEILMDLLSGGDVAGHEMIITGYDDTAIAVDADGNKHMGLFTLRNSWGDAIGDKGDFYMSYDYLKILIIEAQRIRQLKP